MAVIADTSVLVDYLEGRSSRSMEEAIQAESLVLPPIVIAELLSGSDDPFRRAAVGEVLQDFPMQFVDLGHWMAVGDLRRNMKASA